MGLHCKPHSHLCPSQTYVVITWEINSMLKAAAYQALTISQTHGKGLVLTSFSSHSKPIWHVLLALLFYR